MAGISFAFYIDCTRAQSPAPFVTFEEPSPEPFPDRNIIPVPGIQPKTDLDKQTRLDQENRLFERVYKDPSSLTANLELSIFQLQTGNLKGAAASLGRILDLYPNEAQAQLLLAQVEAALGNSLEAKGYYEQVLINPQANSNQKELAKTNLDRLVYDDNLWKYSGIVQVGLGSTLNPLSSPQYVTILGSNYLNSSYANNYDTTWTYLGSVSIEKALESQSNDAIITTISSYNQRYRTYSAANLGINSLSLAYRTGPVSDRATIAINTSMTNLGDKPYINSYWLSANYQKAVSNQVILTIGGSGGYNNQLEGNSFAGSQSRSNVMTSINTGMKYVPTNKWLAEVVYARYMYNAKVNYESYYMNYGMASITYISERGLLSGFGTFTQNIYAAADPISTMQRKIETAMYGLGYTFALPFITKPKPKDFTLNLTYQFGQAQSNVQTYSRDYQQYMAILSKTF